MRKLKEGYSIQLLDDLVADYAPIYNSNNHEKIWKKIMRDFKDEDLANDVLAALEDGEDFEDEDDLYESTLNESENPGESFECKDDKLFDNIQNAIFSILTNYDNEVWEKAGIKRYFEEPTTHGVLVRDQYGSKVFPIHYGLNGPGKDEDYFEAMAKFIVDLEDILRPTYPNVNVYCVNVLVDCADDVGTVVFGVSVGEDIDPKESMEWKESAGGVGKPQDSDEEKSSEWNKGIYEIDHYDPQIDEWE